MNDYTPTEMTRLKRVHKRAHYDRETVHAILDSSPLCHVGYVIDGKPAVTPTMQWREGETVYWHGSSASRALRKSIDMDVCLTVSMMDGLVLARSGFHHSANYRSVMIYGTARLVKDPEIKEARLKTFMDGLYPGRWETLRPMTKQELKATKLLALPLNEVSAKVRTGGPIDDDADYDLPIWAGVVPLTQTIGAPIPDPRNLDGVQIPAHVKNVKLD